MRGSCLDKAKEVINSERQDTYGNPEDSFEIISEYWSTYLSAGKTTDVIIEKEDVMIMMGLLKIARMSAQRYNQDNYVDAAGYIALADDEAVK